MKKILFLFLAAVISLQAKAQFSDIKVLVNKTPDEVTLLYGTPNQIDNGLINQADKTLIYSDFQVFYDKNANDSVVFSGLSFSSDRFCVFSDFIDGGIKVGDSLERLQSIDFVNTPYGRGIQGNALTVLNNQNQYVVYANEYWDFCFDVEDGVITLIQAGKKEDLPYSGYNNPYSPFGN